MKPHEIEALTRKINTILRNDPHEIEGSRLTKAAAEYGSGLRDRLIKTTGDNPLLFEAARVWIERNHPARVTRWHEKSQSYAMQEWI